MIAARRPRRLSGRVERAVFAVVFVAGGALVGHGITVVTTPEPKPVIRTIVHDVAPACREVADMVQAERALAAQLDEAAAVVLEEAARLGDVALTVDPDAITAQAKALDTAKRAEQQAGLDLATAQTTTDATVGDCAPERAQ